MKKLEKDLKSPSTEEIPSDTPLTWSVYQVPLSLGAALCIS
jgi:hypothetical protein